MKTSSSKLTLRAALTALFVTGAALFAQEPPATPERPPAPKAPPAAEPAPAPAADATQTPPVTPAPTAPAAEAAPTAAPATPAAPTQEPAVEAERKSETAPPLRRIDEPDTTSPEATSSTTTRRRNVRTRGNDVPFGDHHVAKDNSVGEAVSIFGSTHVEGEVRGEVVSIFGDSRIESEAIVHGDAVAVLGDLSIEGDVRRDAVGVLGKTFINNHVGGETVSVLGQLELGPKAVIDGDMVVVGGKFKKHPDAIVRGNTVNIPILGGFSQLDWLVTWVKRCLLLGRPLAFGEGLGWAWNIAFAFLALYLLLALIFPRGIEKCLVTFETRPGGSILAAFLTVFLSPIAVVLLAVTVIGVVLIPFFGAALLGAKLFGKAVMLAWIGRRFTRFFGDGPLGHPVFAVLVGGVLVLLLYTVPFFGFLLYKLISWMALGVAVYTIALAMKREKPPVAPAAGTEGGATTMPPPDLPPVAPAPGVEMPVAPGDTVSPTVASPLISDTGFTTASGFVGGAERPSNVNTPLPPPAMPRASVTPPVVPVATLPRAGFFIRMGALLLDLVLVAVAAGSMNAFLPRGLQPEPPAMLLLLAVYGAIMWKLKGTTIGGIVCGLKVVRLDDRPIDWPTAWVRAASCFLSLVVVGLGFIWVVIDDEKQSWHDKIAGTTVVRMPKGVSLL